MSLFPFGGKTERGKRTGAGGEEVLSCDRFHCTGGLRAAVACVLLHAQLRAKGLARGAAALSTFVSEPKFSSSPNLAFSLFLARQALAHFPADD